MLANKFQTTLAIAVLVAGFGLKAQAQQAYYLSDMVRSVIDTNGHVLRGTVTASGDIIDSSGHVIGHAVAGIIDSAGNIVDPSGRTVTTIYSVPGGSQTTTVVTTPSPTIFTAPLSAILDNRQLEIGAMIAAARSQDKLTEPLAFEFRHSLATIKGAEIAAQASGGILSYDEAVDVARDLDSLSAKVATAAALNPFAPLMVVDPSGAVRFNVAPNGYTATTFVTPGSTTQTTTTTSKTVSNNGIVNIDNGDRIRLLETPAGATYTETTTTTER